MKKFINSHIKKFKNKIKAVFKILPVKPDNSIINTKGKLMSRFSGKTFKKFFTSNDSLSINSKQTFIKEEINSEARSILKEAVNNPEILVNFIKSKGTKVVKSKHMKIILFLFKEQEGFLPPMKSYKAFLFTILINIFSRTKLKINFETPALFAFEDKSINIYYLSHQFHLWLSYINELPGFDEITRKNFKNIWDSNANSMELSKFSMEDILSLKDAIARDLEALNFVKEMTREFVGQKQSLNKIKQSGSANI